MGFICIDYTYLWFGLGINSLILSVDFARITAFFFYPQIILMILLINYTQNEKLYSNTLIPFICFDIIYCIVIFNPNIIIAEEIIFVWFPAIFWIDWFSLIITLLHASYLILMMYWALKNYINSPYEIKKYAGIFLIGNIIAALIGFIFYIIAIWLLPILYICLILFAVGNFIAIYAIIKEPKILYVLPFTLYQMKIKNKKGTVIFQHEWTKHELIDAINTVNKEKITNLYNTTKDYMEITIQNLKLMIYYSNNCIIEVYVSKRSQLLEQLVKLFLNDFEIEFRKELEDPNVDLSIFDSTYSLINKYFSNIPSRLLKNGDQDLLFSSKHVKIPPELEKILKEIIQDEDEYNRIKCDYQRSPKTVTKEFLELYEELNRESNQDDTELL